MDFTLVSQILWHYLNVKHAASYLALSICVKKPLRDAKVWPLLFSYFITLISFSGIFQSSVVYLLDSDNLNSFRRLGKILKSEVATVATSSTGFQGLNARLAIKYLRSSCKGSKEVWKLRNRFKVMA